MNIGEGSTDKCQDYLLLATDLSKLIRGTILLSDSLISEF